ncbi:MAG: type II secretion system ATPase GspE [Candidatus Parcubacteria bacterium]|nr:type II secretion system ATPase GspE [Burkholderiales bacterium]
MDAAREPAVRRVPYPFARMHGVLLLELGAEEAVVCLREGARVQALSELRRVLGVPLRIAKIERSDLFERRLAEAYTQANQSAAYVAGNLEQDMDLSRLVQEMPKVEDLLDSENDAPIIRMINVLLTQALRQRASDIHIEPYETRSAVRFRLDGTLQTVAEPHRALHAAMLSRIKIMANLDIAEKRLPQDGRISLRLAGRQVDVRVATLPTGFGERAVLRLLDKEGGKLELTALGMEDGSLARIDHLIHQPHGIVLVTGPTGAGKTTTLYAALSRIDSLGLNIMTVEDPIEYELDGVSQTQVNPRIDMTFARALRSILRHDPDVIMIGEIRDLETAQIAVQASLTGHLVLATLHTNDAVSATTRLVDMGVEPYLLSSSLLGVLAQRLVRKLCPACRVPYHPGAADIAELGGQYAGEALFGPGGCAACTGTGYAGRTGIYELLVVDDEAKRLIHEGATEHLLRTHVISKGMRGLRQDGLRWVLSGVTSLAEVVRVTRES